MVIYPSDLLELVLPDAASRAHPGRRDVLESSARLDAGVRVALHRVVDVSAYLAPVLVLVVHKIPLKPLLAAELIF